ncbi:MAG: YkvA family protein [Acidimicrobiia bacterium]
MPDDDLELSAIDNSVPVERRTWGDVALEAALLLPNLVKLLLRLLADDRVPTRRKVLVGAVVAYVVSPVDLIPDFILGFGHLDDIVVVSVALNHLMEGTSQEVVLEHWDGSQDALDLVQSVFAWGADIVPSFLHRFLPR